MPIGARQYLMDEVEVKKLREKATLRLVCIVAGSLLAALLVPLAAKAWLGSQKISSNDDPAAYEDGMRRYPALAARGSNVYAMWSRRVGSGGGEYDPYYDKSSDNGQNWGTDTNIQPISSTETLAPSLDLTIDSSDRVHFVWAETTGAPQYTLYYSYTIGTAIQTITQTTQMAIQPAIEVNSGDVHVVWAQGNILPTNISYISKTIGTGAWSGSPTKIHSSSGPTIMSMYPDIAVDNMGNLHVVWEESESGDESTILYQKNDGSWLTNPITLSTGITNSRQPAIAVYSDTVNVVWCEYFSRTVQYVRFQQSPDGGSTWDPSSVRISGSALAVNQTVSTYLLPAITVDSNGKIHVAFNGQSTNPAEDIHYVSREPGGGWSARHNVTNNNNNATAPAIAAAGDYVHLIWAEKEVGGDLYDVYYSRTSMLAEDIYLPIILKNSS
ncbi:MAG: hypothetical protein ACETWR_21630 [Anaerolineae bacterium]